MKAKHSELHDGWGLLDAGSSASFISKAKELYGDELKKAMEQAIDDTVVKTFSSLFESHGEFKSEKELKDMYAVKNPERLASILKNGQKFMCPVTNTQLYQDPQYRSSSSELLQEIQTRKRKMIEEMKIKAAKKPKKAKAEVKKEGNAGEAGQAEGDPAAEAKPIKAGERNKVTKLTNDLATASAEMVELIKEASAEDVKCFIPTPVHQQASKIHADLEMHNNGLKLTLEAGSAANIKEDIEKAKASLATSKNIAKLLKGQIESASNLI